jgi:hypothetical protein
MAEAAPIRSVDAPTAVGATEGMEALFAALLADAAPMEAPPVAPCPTPAVDATEAEAVEGVDDVQVEATDLPEMPLPLQPPGLPAGPVLVDPGPPPAAPQGEGEICSEGIESRVIFATAPVATPQPAFPVEPPTVAPAAAPAPAVPSAAPLPASGGVSDPSPPRSDAELSLPPCPVSPPAPVTRPDAVVTPEARADGGTVPAVAAPPHAPQAVPTEPPEIEAAGEESRQAETPSPREMTAPPDPRLAPARPEIMAEPVRTDMARLRRAAVRVEHRVEAPPMPDARPEPAALAEAPDAPVTGSVPGDKAPASPSPEAEDRLPDPVPPDAPDLPPQPGIRLDPAPVTPPPKDFAALLTRPDPPLRSPLVKAAVERLAPLPTHAGETVVRLTPHGLGLIEMRIQEDRHGALEIALRVQNPMVLEAMRHERDAIAQVLTPPQGGQGGQGGSLTMDLFHSGSGQRDAQGQAGGQANTPRSAPTDANPAPPAMSEAAEAAPILRADHVNIVT